MRITFPAVGEYLYSRQIGSARLPNANAKIALICFAGANSLWVMVQNEYRSQESNVLLKMTMNRGAATSGGKRSPPKFLSIPGTFPAWGLERNRETG